MGRPLLISGEQVTSVPMLVAVAMVERIFIRLFNSSLLLAHRTTGDRLQWILVGMISTLSYIGKYFTIVDIILKISQSMNLSKQTISALGSLLTGDKQISPY
jgi:hypothetical protein